MPYAVYGAYDARIAKEKSIALSEINSAQIVNL